MANWRWIHESPAQWDAGKRALVEGAPEGIFDTSRYSAGELVPGEWWRVEDDGRIVGYGWMDCTWGDAEILLVVDAAERGRGIGGFILDQLEREARVRGLNYLYNVVPSTHPDPGRVSAWLGKRRFAASEGGRWMRRVLPERTEGP
jgi:GNAT superfamily N-acetyltransferase